MHRAYPQFGRLFRFRITADNMPSLPTVQITTPHGSPGFLRRLGATKCPSRSTKRRLLPIRPVPCASFRSIAKSGSTTSILSVRYGSFWQTPEITSKSFGHGFFKPVGTATVGSACSGCRPLSSHRSTGFRRRASCFGRHVKQEEDGTSWLLSPVQLPFDSFIGHSLDESIIEKLFPGAEGNATTSGSEPDDCGNPRP